ncbi:MAG: siroheme decarboxylase [Clostridia bacterium]|nr:siroheme decarboxylase [Clostridia bacterium]MDN5323116.1 siroheme decarboxylase [Clostridia bacterium]
MDSIDKKLLTIIQKDFPVCSRPFQELGEQLGISEEETIKRMKKLKEQGIIRRLGGIFDSRKLGYKSTLCAMAVPKEKLPQVISTVNQYLGVTHNYLRDHDYYNLWFTLITPSEVNLRKTLTEIERETGLKVYNLPALKLFKIKVNFHVPGVEGERGIV